MFFENVRFMKHAFFTETTIFFYREFIKDGKFWLSTVAEFKTCFHQNKKELTGLFLLLMCDRDI